MKIIMRGSLILTVFLCLYGISSGVAVAEVNVNIGVFAPPPPLVIESPPAMAVVSGTPYVYFAPDITVGLFFYAGHWYRPYEGRWFRARSYRGPWKHMHHGSVPPALVRLPSDYRRIPPGHRGIPYGHMKRDWKSWERERHWDSRAVRHSGHPTRCERNEPRMRMGNGGRRDHGGPKR